MASVCVVEISLISAANPYAVTCHWNIIVECSPLWFVSSGHWFCLQIKIWVCFLELFPCSSKTAFCSELEVIWAQRVLSSSEQCQRRDLPSALCCVRDWKQEHPTGVLLEKLNYTKIHPWIRCQVKRKNKSLLINNSTMKTFSKVD